MAAPHLASHPSCAVQLAAPREETAPGTEGTRCGGRWVPAAHLAARRVEGGGKWARSARRTAVMRHWRSRRAHQCVPLSCARSPLPQSAVGRAVARERPGRTPRAATLRVIHCRPAAPHRSRAGDGASRCAHGATAEPYAATSFAPQAARLALDGTHPGSHLTQLERSGDGTLPSSHTVQLAAPLGSLRRATREAPRRATGANEPTSQMCRSCAPCRVRTPLRTCRSHRARAGGGDTVRRTRPCTLLATAATSLRGKGRSSCHRCPRYAPASGGSRRTRARPSSPPCPRRRGGTPTCSRSQTIPPHRSRTSTAPRWVRSPRRTRRSLSNQAARPDRRDSPMHTSLIPPPTPYRRRTAHTKFAPPRGSRQDTPRTPTRRSPAPHAQARTECSYRWRCRRRETYPDRT